MKVKKGTAGKVSLAMMPKMRSGSAWSSNSPRPSGSIIFTGQQMRPPGFCDISPDCSEFMTIDHDSHKISAAIGIRKRKMSTMFCMRGERRLVRTSMRTCALRRKV